MPNQTHGLKCQYYTQDVSIRLNKANKNPIRNNLDYRYVALGVEIFPIHIDMVDTYNNSDRSFKRGMKKSYKKMLKKSNKINSAINKASN